MALLLRTHSIRTPQRRKTRILYRKHRNRERVIQNYAQPLRLKKSPKSKCSVSLYFPNIKYTFFKVSVSPSSSCSVKQFSFFLCAGQVAQTAGVSAQLLQAHTLAHTHTHALLKVFKGRLRPIPAATFLVRGGERLVAVEKCERTHLAAIKWS